MEICNSSFTKRKIHWKTAEYGSVSSLGTVKLIDFKKALEAMEDNKTDNNSNPEEVQFSLIYLTELKQQATNAKRGKLDKWKHQNVNVQEEDIGHQCTLVRWLLSRKIIAQKSVTKVRLCARGFKELS